METMPGHAQSYRVDTDHDILSLTTSQMLNLYVEEIFSDYLSQAATLPEVMDEIKAIIQGLILTKTGSAAQVP